MGSVSIFASLDDNIYNRLNARGFNSWPRLYINHRKGANAPFFMQSLHLDRPKPNNKRGYRTNNCSQVLQVP
jgi:hypothetical protein